MNNLTLRKDISRIEEVMKSLPQVELKINHKFLPGIYVREMIMPKGTVITGKIHKKDHIMILSKGEVAVVSEQFEGIISAPVTLECKAGAKRVATALTDTVWITIHSTTETDLVKLEKELIANSFNELEYK